MRSGVEIFLPLIFLLLAYVSSAEELDDAMNQESSGNRLQAIHMYREWLEAESGDSRFPDVLLHTASLYESPDESLDLLQTYLPILDPGNRYGVLARMAGLESSLGLLDSAALHFQMASESDSLDADRWMYESLSLRFLMGEFSEVRPDALDLSRKSRLSAIRDQAAALAALSLAYTGGISDALEELDLYIGNNSPVRSPLVWFSLHKIASLNGNTQVLKRSYEHLMNSFPSSVLGYIADSKLPEWDSPSLFLFKPESTSEKSVQVGAFGSRDAASALRIKLENDGFIAWIVKNGNIWRVYVNDPAGDAVSRLVAEGYESLF